MGKSQVASLLIDIKISRLQALHELDMLQLFNYSTVQLDMMESVISGRADRVIWVWRFTDFISSRGLSYVIFAPKEPPRSQKVFN